MRHNHAPPVATRRSTGVGRPGHLVVPTARSLESRRRELGVPTARSLIPQQPAQTRAAKRLRGAHLPKSPMTTARTTCAVMSATVMKTAPMNHGMIKCAHVDATRLRLPRPASASSWAHPGEEETSPVGQHAHRSLFSPLNHGSCLAPTHHDNHDTRTHSQHAHSHTQHTQRDAQVTVCSRRPAQVGTSSSQR